MGLELLRLLPYLGLAHIILAAFLWWRIVEKAGYPGWVAGAIWGIHAVLFALVAILGLLPGVLSIIMQIYALAMLAALCAFAFVPWPREGGMQIPFGPQAMAGGGPVGQPPGYGAPLGYPPQPGYAPQPYGQPPGYAPPGAGPGGYGSPPPVAPPPSYGQQPPVAPPPPSYGAQPPVSPPPPSYGGQPPIAPPPPSYGGQPPVAPPPPSYGGQPPAAPPPSAPGEPEATVIGGRAMPAAGGPPTSAPGAAPPAGAAPAGGPGWALSTPGPGGTPFVLSLSESKATYTVSGQGGGGDLVVPEASIGNPHARLHLAGGRVGLEDLGSPGGTAIDGAQLLPSHGIREVTQSKKIRLGALEFSLTRV